MKPTYLYLIPPGTRLDDQRKRRLRDQLGDLQRIAWVYVADENVREIEDDDSGVRYLPWRQNISAAFGSLDRLVRIHENGEEVILAVPDTPAVIELATAVPA